MKFEQGEEVRPAALAAMRCDRALDPPRVWAVAWWYVIRDGDPHHRLGRRSAAYSRTCIYGCVWMQPLKAIFAIIRVGASRNKSSLMRSRRKCRQAPALPEPVRGALEKRTTCPAAPTAKPVNLW